MRFVVPLVSLVLLLFAISELWLYGQHQQQAFDSSLFNLSLFTPYLLVGLLLIQGNLLFNQARFSAKKTSNVIDSNTENAIKPLIDVDQVSTDWVLDALAGGVVVANLQGFITYMNPSAEKMTEWKRDKAVGVSVGTVLRLEDLQGELLLTRIFETYRLHPAHSLQFGQVKLFCHTGDFRFVELNALYIQEEHPSIVFIFRDVTADRKIINRLYHQASRDPLTDLMNKSSFEQYVEQLARDTSGLMRTHILASIDLDNFKIINDTCGHQAGDELLKQVAHIFRRGIRTSDKVARIGGDEFSIFLEGCSIEKGHTIMEAILTELRNFRFSREGKIFSVGASIGLVEFSPSTHIQIKQLFANADKACYTAKALGRNQVFAHVEHEVQPISNQRVDDWSKLLKNALRDNLFILFVQPIVPLSSEHAKTPAQYEVLLRLPFRQALLSPGSFLPVADRLDLTASIDRWIIHKSLEVLAGCQHNQTQPLMLDNRLMINLSAQSVQHIDLLDFIEQQLKHFSINPAMVCFEISESVAVSNFVQAKQLMSTLSALGCHLVLDDFGSGFSSLNYLRELPLSYLKIDGNFVHNLVANPIDAAMVKAVHEVGQVMNLLTIAELVEDAETLAHLRTIGVDFAQGYFCGRPIPLSQLQHTLPTRADSALS